MDKASYRSLYFAFLILAMLYQCRQLTLWGFYQDIVPVFRWCAMFLALPILAYCMPKYKGKEFLLIILISIIVFFAGYNSDNLTILLLSYTIVIGAKDIKFRDIVKIHFIFGLFFCFFNIVGRELDLIPRPNLIEGNEREGTFGNIVTREDFGYGFPTDFALHVFYILLDYWILKNRRLKGFEILVYLYSVYFVITYSDARLAAICILLIVLLSLSLPLFYRKTFINKYIAIPFLIVCIPFFAVISIGATIMFDESNIYWIGADLLFSGRLHLGQNSMQEAGISMFGQTYTMYGMGSLGIGDEYNYIDCSYLQSLVFWGIVLTVILVLIFVKICKSASSRMDYVLLFAIFIAGISGVVAQFFYFLAYCPLIIAIVAQHEDYGIRNSCENAKSLKTTES